MQIREVRHDEQASRYVLWIDDEQVGLADYLLRGDEIVFTHTEIDPAKRHGGLGSTLIQGALDQVQETGLRVVPACPFVAEWIDTHDEYRSSPPAGGRRRRLRHATERGRSIPGC